ncbi:MAG: EcsC family protein [Lactococcus sp.]
MEKLNDKNQLINGLGKAKEISQEQIMKVLDWGYEQTVNGLPLPGQKTVNELAEDYLSKYGKDKAIKKLTDFQTLKAGTSGFVTGFGGIVTMPVAIPANITTVLLTQMRLIGAIAVINGYDLKSDQVQTFVYVCLAGSSVNDLLKGTTIKIGTNVVKGVIEKIPGKALTAINQRVGFRLITKFGTKGTVNLGKLLPGVGAVIGATLDIGATRIIARTARKTFTSEGIDLGDGEIINP